MHNTPLPADVETPTILKYDLIQMAVSAAIMISVVVAVACIHKQTQELATLKTTNQAYQDTIKTLTTENSPSSARPDYRLFTTTMTSSPRTGWVTYTSERLGISFQYPSNQLTLEERTNQTTGALAEIALTATNLKNFEGQPLTLLEFKPTYNPMTYDIETIPVSTDSATYTIDGQQYHGENFVMGEGHGCGGGMVKSKLFQLRPQIVVYRLETQIERNKDPENCTSDEFDIIKTTPSYLNLADQVIKTVRVLKPTETADQD